MNRVEKASEYHKKGYNCCQAVLCAFAEELGVDMQTAFRIGEGFGLGMGCMEGTCGALSGAIMTVGLKKSTGNLEKPDSKAASYQLSKEMLLKFKERSGSTICRELKGVGTGVVLCSCPQCIENGVKVAEEVLGI